LDTVGLLEDCTYRFSKWDPNNTEKYEGTKEQWDEAQDVMERMLDHLEVPYSVGIDEAAFYGPKLDIQIKNVHGKEDTIVTIQIDMLLATKFGMEYIDSDGERKTPYIIHRTSLGCYERTLALLLEKYAGALPAWLAPTQVAILPITDRQHDYSKSIESALAAHNIRVETDTRSEKVGYKIREAQMQKVPFMLVLGDKEQEAGTVAVRSRAGGGDIGTMKLQEFIELITTAVNTKAKD
ncbi:MAG: His/Gly/Thr/Pro-type tRNA ligase C-terminal domain-containing protein, partial [Clostridia bacterium]